LIFLYLQQYADACIGTLYRLENVTEFDCFVKSFVYLAARLPRTDFLEPFLEEATKEPVENVKSQMATLQEMKKDNLSQVVNFDVSAMMEGLQMSVGRPTVSTLESPLPLSEAEPDIFPCMLAVCGSGFGFFQVCATHMEQKYLI
jgi:hypothetical protein